MVEVRVEDGEDLDLLGPVRSFSYKRPEVSRVTFSPSMYDVTVHTTNKHYVK